MTAETYQKIGLVLMLLGAFITLHAALDWAFTSSRMLWFQKAMRYVFVADGWVAQVYNDRRGHWFDASYRSIGERRLTFSEAVYEVKKLRQDPDFAKVLCRVVNSKRSLTVMLP